MSESETAQQTSNLSQEFVGYVQQKVPGDASRILTNTADENVRHEREALADSFVEEKLRSRIEGDFNSNRASLANGMQNVEPSNGDSAGLINSGQQEIERRAHSAGIRGDMAHEVDNSLTRNQGVMDQAGANIEQGHSDIQREGSKINSEHVKANQVFEKKYHDAVSHQDDSPKNLKKKITDIMKDNDDKE